MTDIHQFSGRKFAAIVVDYCENKDGDWYVVSGLAKIKAGHLFVDRGTEIDFPIPEDTYDRIKEVSSDIASIVDDAEFFTTLTVGPKPNDNGA